MRGVGEGGVGRRAARRARLHRRSRLPPAALVFDSDQLGRVGRLMHGLSNDKGDVVADPAHPTRGKLASALGLRVARRARARLRAVRRLARLAPVRA